MIKVCFEKEVCYETQSHQKLRRMYSFVMCERQVWFNLKGLEVGTFTQEKIFLYKAF